MVTSGNDDEGGKTLVNSKEAGIPLDKDDDNDNNNGDYNDLDTEIHDEDTHQTTNIAKTTLNTVYPWVRSFLLKDVIDHKGQTSKVVRPQIAVALTNLIKLVPPLVSDENRHNLLVNLVMNIVNM